MPRYSSMAAVASPVGLLCFDSCRGRVAWSGRKCPPACLSACLSAVSVDFVACCCLRVHGRDEVTTTGEEAHRTLFAPAAPALVTSGLLIWMHPRSPVHQQVALGGGGMVQRSGHNVPSAGASGGVVPGCQPWFNALEAARSEACGRVSETVVLILVGCPSQGLLPASPACHMASRPRDSFARAPRCCSSARRAARLFFCSLPVLSLFREMAPSMAVLPRHTARRMFPPRPPPPSLSLVVCMLNALTV